MIGVRQSFFTPGLARSDGRYLQAVGQHAHFHDGHMQLGGNKVNLRGRLGKMFEFALTLKPLLHQT